MDTYGFSFCIIHLFMVRELYIYLAMWSLFLSLSKLRDIVHKVRLVLTYLFRVHMTPFFKSLENQCYYLSKKDESFEV